MKKNKKKMKKKEKNCHSRSFFELIFQLEGKFGGSYFIHHGSHFGISSSIDIWLIFAWAHFKGPSDIMP